MKLENSLHGDRESCKVLERCEISSAAGQLICHGPTALPLASGLGQSQPVSTNTGLAVFTSGEWMVFAHGLMSSIWNTCASCKHIQ
jgi:hypothetical protein